MKFSKFLNFLKVKKFTSNEYNSSLFYNSTSFVTLYDFLHAISFDTCPLVGMNVPIELKIIGCSMLFVFVIYLGSIENLIEVS